MRVVLVELPFKRIDSPSIGLSILRTKAVAAGFDCQIIYSNLQFARALGVSQYASIVDSPAEYVLGDLAFAAQVRAAPLLRSAFATSLSQYPRMYKDFGGADLHALVHDCQRAVDSFVDALAAQLADTAEVVGLTAMFQLVPALAVAKRLKQIRPSCIVILGGSHCFGTMGAAVLRGFDFVDFVCTGEGEVAFPHLLAQIAINSPEPSTPGVLSRRTAKRPKAFGQSPSEASFVDLATVQTPSYDDWFSQRAANNFSDEPKSLSLPFELSRGCWFGEKSHCVFCGLNADAMAYRSKPPEKALQDILVLGQYGVKNLEAVDQILDHRYFDTLLPALAATGHDFSLFCEIKSNLSYSQMSSLRSAGFKRLQPGIESLSTAALKRMRKGVSAWQNIAVLLWAAELGMDISWNWLYGLPGELSTDYDRAVDLLPHISHLQPPMTGCRPVRADRFSPLWRDWRAFFKSPPIPSPMYDLVYGEDFSFIPELAYHFDVPREFDGQPEYLARLLKAVGAWHARAGTLSLTTLRTDSGTLLVDRRTSRTHSALLSESEQRVADLCLRRCRSAGDLEHSLGVSDLAALDDLRRRAWLIEVDGRLLWLPVSLDSVLSAEDHPITLLPNIMHAVYTGRMSRLWANVGAAWTTSFEEETWSNPTHGTLPV